MDVETDYYTIKTYPDIIFVQAFYSWDERVMNQHIKEMSQLVGNRYEGKFYAMLANGMEWTLNTPKAEYIGRENLGRAFGPGLTHLAMVVGSSPVKEWQAENMKSGFQGFESRVFRMKSQALDWISQAGYDTAFLK